MDDGSYLTDRPVDARATGGSPPMLSLAAGGAGKPILDYAGPRQRSKFRIGSASRIEWAQGPPAAGAVGPSYVRVLEYLGSQGRAVGAIVAGAVMLGLAALNFWLNRRGLTWTQIGVLGGVIAVGLGLLPVVIQENWRRTILTWDGAVLRLAFWGPLRARRFEWAGDQVHWVGLVRTQEQAGAPVLAELQLLATGTPTVHLFTDHPEAELSPIYEALAKALGIGAYAARA